MNISVLSFLKLCISGGPGARRMFWWVSGSEILWLCSRPWAFFPVKLLKRDDRFEDGDVETDETRRLSGSLSKSAEMQLVNTPRQQPQTDTDQRRVLRSESLTPTSQGYSPAGRVETSQSAGSTPPGNSSSFTLLGLSSDQSTYDALKGLETIQPPSNPGSDLSLFLWFMGGLKWYLNIN